MRKLLYFALSTAIFLCIFINYGCRNNGNDQAVNPPGNSNKSPDDGLEAEEIVVLMQSAYKNATNYHDHARLHLSYQLQGRYMEEPHHWQIEYQRPGNLKASIYNVRVFANDHQLGCFIFDFNSGNLDNQWAVHSFNDQLPLRPLFSDGICRHYITGQTELPINVDHPDAQDVFFPPTLGLLTDQARIPWLQGQTKRIADTEVSGKPCFQVEFTKGNLKFVACIDKQNHLLRQLSYPIELLDSRLQVNDAVLNLNLTAVFHDASFQASASGEEFEVSIPAEAKIVANFVAVPEPFPSASIGKPVPNLGLREMDGRLVTQSTWKGKVTLLTWLSDSTPDRAIAEVIEKVARDLTPREYHFAQIAVIESGLPRDNLVQNHFKSIAKDFGQGVYADFDFAGGTALGLKSYPTIAIIDRNGVLQFVKAADQELTVQGIANVLARIRSGDDVAAEMKQEYELFLEDYQKRLAVATLEQNTNASGTSQLVIAGKPNVINVKKQWHSDELKQPGNIYKTPRGLLAIDGWRTLVELARDGTVLRRKELNIDSQQSISVIRNTLVPDPQYFAAFSVMGKTVFIVDSDFSPQGKFEVADKASGSASPKNRRISDAVICNLDDDEQVEMIIAVSEEGGLELVQFPGETSSIVDQGYFRSIALIRPVGDRQYLVVCKSDGSLAKLSFSDGDMHPIDSDLSAATQINVHHVNHSLAICALGTDGQGRWMACGFDQHMNQTWTAAIGSQRFDTQIESAAYAKIPNAQFGIWLVAASDGSITIIGDDGRMMDRWDFGKPVHGIELMSGPGGYLAVISTENRIEGWTLTLPATVFSSASHKR